MKKSLKVLIIVLCLIIVGLIAFIVWDKVINKKLNVSESLEIYKGYWYTDKESGNSTTEYTELNIKDINGNVITFDYDLAMICADKDITAEINDGKGEFKTNESQGTIKLSDNKVELKVKNIKYNDTDFETVFSYKSSDKRKTNIANSNNEQSEMTREEALELGEKMYKEVEGYYEKMSKIRNDIETDFTESEAALGVVAKIEDNTFMENVKKLLIKDAFNNFMEYYDIEDRNGEYYTFICGSGDNPLYISTNDLTIKNMDNYTITYIATSVYDNLDYTGTETKDYEFVLTKIDGEWKVENFTIPY